HADPLQERAGELLVTALAAAGRRSQALAELQRIRTALQDDLGIELGPGLRRLATRLATTADGPVAPLVPGIAPRQLPPAAGVFVGREAELARIESWLGASSGGQGSLLVIRGSGGLGKTALAVHAGHQLARRFPGGQLYVAFRAFDHSARTRTGSDVLPGLLSSLGIALEEQPSDVDDQSALLRSVLADRKVLLLLDDVPDADSVRALRTASPDSVTLVTTRRVLTGLVVHDGARELALEPLGEDEGLALLGRVLDRDDAAAGARAVSTDREAAAQLVRLCGGWPLALRIAASYVHATLRGSLPDVVAQLQDERTRLAQLAIPDDPLVDVRTVLGWSVRALSPDAARAHRVLGLLPVECAVPQVLAAALQLEQGRAVAVLAELASHHLAAPVHDLVHLHAAELAVDLPVPDRRAAIGRVLDWYVDTTAATVDLIYPGQHETSHDAAPDAAAAAIDATGASRWLVEHDDLLQRLVVLAAARDHPAAHTLPAALRRYLSEPEFGRTWGPSLLLARQSARRHADQLAEAKLLPLLAVVATHERRFDDAVELTRDAARLRFGDRWHVERGLIGTVLYEAQRYDESVTELDAAVAHPEVSDVLRVNYLQFLGLAHWSRGDAPAAVAAVERMLPLFDRIEPEMAPRWSIEDRLGAGSLLRVVGERERARTQLVTALAASRRYGFDDLVGETSLELAVVEHQLGDEAASERHLQHAAALASSFLSSARSNLVQHAPVYEGFEPFLDELERRAASTVG
ncbi:NB-ARC domain-containing protein, partial [Angustibacter aerolatus]